MYRVYTCGSCGTIGYSRIESESENSNCELCGGLVIHGPGMIYAVTSVEARDYVREMVNLNERDKPSSNSRSRGVRRRVIDIVQTLVDLNRGKPIAYDAVLIECVDAGIDVDRARHFLDLLIGEGIIGQHDRGIKILEGRYDG
jgi:hypothetical protein